MYHARKAPTRSRPRHEFAVKVYKTSILVFKDETGTWAAIGGGKGTARRIRGKWCRRGRRRRPETSYA